MMKKSRIKILCAFLALCGLGACSSDNTADTTEGTTSNNASNTEATEVTLTLWHYYNGTTKDALDVMISEFNESLGAEQNITVEAYSYSSVGDLASAVVSSAMKEVGKPEMPHIFSAYTDTALLLDNMGLVANMDNYFSQEELALFQQDFLNEGRFDAEGNLKIIPVAKSTELLFVNETDFQQFSEATGVQLSQMETWEGLAEVAELYYHWTDAQTETPEDGRALFGVDSEANFMLVAARQLGEEMYDYSGDSIRFGLSENAARKIWDYMIVPYIKGYYSRFGSYRSDDLKSGDLLLYAGSTSSVYYFPSLVELGRAEAYEIEGTALAYPYFQGEEKVVVQQGAGMVVSVSDTVYETASAEFLKWFTSPENNLAFAVSTGYMPVQNEALSLDGVLSVLSDSGEMNPIMLDALTVTYEELLPEFEFYANRPFDGSYDTRSAIASSVMNVVAESRAEFLKAQEDFGEESPQEAQEIQDALVGEESFQQWYQQLEKSVTELLP